MTTLFLIIYGKACEGFFSFKTFVIVVKLYIFPPKGKHSWAQFSFSAEKVSTSENDLILFPGSTKMFILDFSENLYHIKSSFDIKHEMHGCTAFISPTGKTIVLSKNCKEDQKNQQVNNTRTWIMNHNMTIQGQCAGDFGDLLAVTDGRLLYQKSGRVLAVYHMNHGVENKIVTDGNVTSAVMSSEGRVAAVAGKLHLYSTTGICSFKICLIKMHLK